MDKLLRLKSWQEGLLVAVSLLALMAAIVFLEWSLLIALAGMW